MRIAITGGGGYVGSALVPRLLERGDEVAVLDLFLYGRDVLPPSPRLRLVEGDIRDPAALAEAFDGAEAVIHLACISNDPSFELDPNLGRSINYDAFAGILDAVRRCGARRFIYASSSSVYGLRDEPAVTEDSPCTPLTDYSKFKLLCEEDLRNADLGSCDWVIVRPATVCGYAPRLRLDLTVNILTIQAIAKGVITVFGGNQLRPNIHVRDMVRLYETLLDAPPAKIHGRTFNGGWQNLSVMEIAKRVAAAIGGQIEIRVEPTDDHRSYHIDSSRIRRELGFEARHTVEDAVREIAEAHRAGRIPNALSDPRYYNIRRMKEAALR